jgi:hypothetical protein
MWHERSHGTDGEALPSVCCAKTSWPPTNATFIGVLSFRTRCTRRIASLLACADNGVIIRAFRQNAPALRPLAHGLSLAPEDADTPSPGYQTCRHLLRLPALQPATTAIPGYFSAHACQRDGGRLLSHASQPPHAWPLLCSQGLGIIRLFTEASWYVCQHSRATRWIRAERTRAPHGATPGAVL